MEFNASATGELSREPRELTDGDVVLELTASSASALPGRSSALLQLKEAVRDSYQALMPPADVQLETVALLEELPAHRATAWVRIHVAQSGSDRPDGAPPLGFVLKSAAHATLAILRWMNQPGQPRLRHLRQAIETLSTGTAEVAVDNAAAPSSSQLATAIRAWERARAALHWDERARVITRRGSVDIHAAGASADSAELLIEKKVVNPRTDMIFVVELPDYGGTGEWKLKHGRTQVIASCASGTLLDRFYRRELDIRPGDALHCRVAFETAYGPDYEVISEKFRIVEVVEVLTASRSRGAAERGLAASERSLAERAELDALAEPRVRETAP
jgi:hypothetical protein